MGTTTRHPYEPDYAVAPGDTLAETIESLGMSQKELALRTGLTEQSINRIVHGSQPITFETASKLELATGVPARVWNNLESQYREQLARIEEHRQLEQDLDWLKTIPVNELKKRGVLPNEKDKPTLLRHALAFYGVSSVAQFEAYWREQAVAARKSQSFDSHTGPTSAWIRLGELRAKEIETQPYDRGRFIAALGRIRRLTRKGPAEFVPKVTELCANAGVAFCLVPEFVKAPWYGASMWLTKSKAMILLGLRGKRDDQFWFSFFHEAAHILNDSKKEMFLSDGTKDDPREKKADEFASNFLVPPVCRPEVAELRTKAQVHQLAGKLDIAPGIVVGQYQHMTGDFARFNDLKRKFVWGQQTGADDVND